MMPTRDRLLRISERVYRSLLLVYPREFRDTYGPQMIQVFGDSCRAEMGKMGLFGLLALWVRVLPDLVSTAFTERGCRAASDGTFVLPFAGSPRIVRWGGVSAVAGGVCALVSLFLDDLSLIYFDEPVFNAFASYHSGASSYPPFVVLLHPIVSEFLGTLASLLLVTAFIGLYAMVSRRSGRIALWGGSMMCFAFVILLVMAGSNAYRMFVTFSGNFGHVATNPLIYILDIGAPVLLIGALLLSLAVLRTGALGGWSILPLALMPLGILLRLLLLRLGYPVSDAPLALREGIGTMAITELPDIVSYLGWMLLGYLMWRFSRGAEMMPEGVADEPRISEAKE
jgi:hypothetical protein